MSWLTGREIVEALGGTWAGSRGMAHCPAHDDDTVSLSVTDIAGCKTLLCCHAGCTNQAVIAALRERGLWGKANGQLRANGVVRWRPAGPEPNGKQARELWNSELARPIHGTLAEGYLRARGITLPLPSCLRFHECLWHPQELTSFPAMLAAVWDTDSRHLVAVQRTYLDGPAKAKIAAPRLTLGSMGAGAVRLAPRWEGVGWTRLGLAEGVETALSAMQIHNVPVWAALGASRLAQVRLPDAVKTVIIFRDNDLAGVEAASLAAVELIGRVGCVLTMSPRGRAKDFNDELMAGRA